MRGILVRDGDAPSPDGRTARRRWTLWLAAALALAALPVVGVRYPPILDLPQQLAQIDLLGRALADPATSLRIQWWQPDRIAYPLLALARLAGDAWAPRLAVLLTQAVWIGALFGLARRFGRPADSAFVASLFVWQAAFYGGYLHFLVGFVAFALWLAELAGSGPETSARRRLLGGFAGGLLLYLAHVLWLAAGVVTLAVVAAIGRRPWRRELPRLLGLAPWIAAAGLFAVWLGRAGWGSALHWETTPLERLLSAPTIAAFLLGGLSGATEVAALAGVALWVVLGVARRGEGGVRWHPVLAGGGLLLTAGALFAPDAAGATALFACRWGPPGAALLVLGAPAPRPVFSLRRLLAVAVVASFTAATVLVWTRYEERFGRDLGVVLARIGAGDRVLELDFERRSPGLRMETLMHMAAYAELERGAEAGYSFAEVPTSLVVRAAARTNGADVSRLRHLPGSLEQHDLESFDRVLLCSGPEAEAELMSRFEGFVPEFARGRWRLLGRPAGGSNASAGVGAGRRGAPR